MPKRKDSKKPKAKRGFACMPTELQAKICAKGGRTTAKRHGRAHMSRIGRNGRAIRTKREKAAKKAKMA